jgi:signal transduction histidine kinase/CheY-like chemotaxis protein
VNELAGDGGPSAKPGVVPRFGLRWRLLLAFFGVSAFAVLGAGAAIYSFSLIDDALALITRERVPASVKSQEVSRIAERIAVAAPTLFTSTSQSEIVVALDRISRDSQALEELVTELQHTGTDPAFLVALRVDVGSLRDNLVELNRLVKDQVLVGEQKSDLLLEANYKVGSLQGLLVPFLSVIDEQIDQWRRQTNDASIKPERRAEVDSEFAKVLARTRALQNSEVLASSVSDFLQRTASADDANIAAVNGFRLQQSLNELDTLAGQFDPRLQTPMQDVVRSLRPYAAGTTSLATLRRRELEMRATGHQLLNDNATLAKTLTSTVDDLVAAAGRDITLANGQVLSLVRVSTWILIGAVAFSLVSSVLIVWLYVGRNIVSRLADLGATMIAIAGGRRDMVAISSGKDEIASMGRAVEVFRHNAIELDRLLAAQEQEAARLEQVVLARTAELQVTFDNMENGVLMFDREWKLAAWNRQALGMLDLSEAFTGGKPHYSEFVRFLAMSGEYGDVDVEGQVRRLLDRLETSPAYTFERTRPNGRIFEIRHRPIAEGGFVIIYSDITERKHYEEALSAARDQAEAMSRTKSTFLANMSHELRTPLNAIIGYSELLQEDAADTGNAEPVPDLQKIESAGRHLLGLINNILDLSKIEAGKMDVFIEEVDLRALVDDVLSIITPLVDKNGNRIEVVCPADIGSFRSDQTKVKQALLNLLSNACKFTSKGTVTLAVARESGSRVSFRVSDTGLGMRPEQLGRLFEAFSQADASTTKRFGGTGLGLAITKHFCTMLGGEVGMESTQGVGSTFTITLPDYAEIAAAEPVAQEAEAADGRPTVLVVDDDPMVHDLLAKTLDKEGYRVISALSGAEALAMARKHRPQAITLDVLMPRMDGWTTLKELKGDAELNSIPVIMVSNLHERGLAIPLGAADYMTKPIDKPRLAAILREHCADPDTASILVIEDDLSTSDVLCRTLTGLGYASHPVVNGREGLDWLAGHPAPNLILLDLMMPEMDGFEFLRELRKRPPSANIPVIVVTAKALTDEDIQLLIGQTERIIAKDANYLGELSVALRALLQRQPVLQATN